MFQPVSQSDKAKQLETDVVLRNYDAYLEILPSLDALLDYTYAAERKYPKRGEIYSVKGFYIKCDVNDIPMCNISMPSGEFVRNMYHRVDILDKSDSYSFNAVNDIASYSEIVNDVEHSISNQYKACILWYKEWMNDSDKNDETKNKFKPVFKGVIHYNSFTKVAHEQESINVCIRHFICLLDTVLAANGLLDLQSDIDVNSPWFFKTRSGNMGFSDSSGTDFTPNLSSEFIKLQSDATDKDVKVFESIIRFLQSEIKLYRQYPLMYENLKSAEVGGDGATIESIIDANLKFVDKLLEYLLTAFKIASAKGWVSDPALTASNVGNSTGCPAAVFQRAAMQVKQGNFLGMTYYQCMVSLCAAFSLHLVCTANTVSFEAVRYRTHTWNKNSGSPIRNASVITGDHLFSRNIVSSVVNLKGSDYLAGRGQAELSSSPSSASKNYVWGPVYIEDGTSKDLTLGSVALFNVPQWFNSTIHESDLQRYIFGADRGIAVAGNGSGVPLSKDIPDNAAAEVKALAGLTKSLHFMLKSQNRKLNISMPININLGVGMPICVQNSSTGLYSSGIILTMMHTVSQENLTAHTSIILGYIDFFSSDTVPENNKNTSEEDDKNPFFTEAFTGRPIYA